MRDTSLIVRACCASASSSTVGVAAMEWHHTFSPEPITSTACSAVSVNIAKSPSRESPSRVAVVAAGRQNLTDRAYATWHLSYSEGAGENIMAFAGTDANAVLDVNGYLETFPAFAAVLGFGYDWTPTLSSNLSYAYGWLDTPDTRDPLALKRGGIGHVNLIWKPNNNKHFSTGVELMWGETRVQNDATGDAARLQLMAKFEF